MLPSPLVRIIEIVLRQCCDEVLFFKKGDWLDLLSSLDFASLYFIYSSCMGFY